MPRCPHVTGGSSSTRDLLPDVRQVADAFITVLRHSGIYDEVNVTSTRRSEDTQRQLYVNWLNGCSKYPAAAPGHSMHQIGAAFDLELVPGDYTPAGEFWESIGGTWGGRFNDPIHFEVPLE